LKIILDKPPVWVTLVVGFSFSVAAAFGVNRWEQANRAEWFERQVSALQVALQSYLDSSTQVARSLAAIQMIRGQLHSDELDFFASQVLRGASALVGLGYAPRLTGSQLRSLDREAWKISADGQQQALMPSDAGEYFPTTIFIPMPGEATVELGFEHGSDWRRRAAIAKARDTATLATTSEVPLATNPSLTGFVLYVPAYAAPSETLKPEELQQAFVGVTYVVLSSQTLLQQAIQEANARNLQVYLYRLPVDYLDSALLKQRESLRASLQDTLLAGYQDGILTKQSPRLPKRDACPQQRDRLACLRSVNWVDGEWSIFVLPNANSGFFSWRVGSTLALGGLITLLFSFYLASSLERLQQQAYWLNALLLSSAQLKRQKECAEQALRQLMKTQSQLVHAEKMSGLGQLVAGIAHEINNPVSFIFGNVSYAAQYAGDLLDLLSLYQQEYSEATPAIRTRAEEIELDFIREDFLKIINSMKLGAQRIREIVVSMRNFSRLDEAELKPADLLAGLESTLTILRHRLKAKGGQPEIAVVKQYESIPPVECAAGQMNQVFMNLLSNSIEALREAAIAQKC